LSSYDDHKTEKASCRDQPVIVGIDLGTTNSLVAICDEHGPRILTDESDQSITPSVIRFFPDEPDREPIIGQVAVDHLIEFPHETVYSVKRLMGKSSLDVADDLDYLSYEVVEGDHQTARVKVGDRLYSPPEISALILRELKQVAEESLQQPVHNAVITVPAYFDDAQRQATRDAGRIAGLNVQRIVNEPTAAALAYGLGRSNEPETVVVFDLGGGTFDISILRIVPGLSDGMVEQNESGEQINPGAFFQVVSTAGDTHLGGDDVDRLIVELVQIEIRDQFGQTLTFPPSTRQALRRFAEATKIQLSENESANLQVDLGDDRLYQRTIERDEFETMIGQWVDRAIVGCQKALRDAKMQPDQIDRVVMVGGSTRIPLVRKRVGEFFTTEPYTALDPDRVVALGASVQAAIMSGSYQEALLLDVIPLSLGIETMGGAVAKIIMSNSMVPCEATEMFSTSVDGQTSIKIHVLQGEREMVRDSRSLGEFHLSGIPPMPAGIPKLEVTFHVDANGILNVSAVEKRSGKQADIQIVPNHGLSREEVDQMELDSYKHARQDMNLHRIVDLRVNSALDLKWIKDRIVNLADEIDEGYRAELDGLINALSDFVKRSETDPESIDPDAFLAAKEALDNSSVRLHEISIAASLRNDD